MRWTPLSELSGWEWKRSICFFVKQIRTDPKKSPPHEVAHLIGGLYGLNIEIQRQHSPDLHSFTTDEVRLTGCSDEQSMLQEMITLETQQGSERGLDQITGLTLTLFIQNSRLGTDSGHEYKWYSASIKVGITSSINSRSFKSSLI